MMPRPLAACALVAALVCLAPAAQAGPVIDEFSPSESIPNDVVTIKGAGFSEVVADIVVTVGNERAIVLAATPETITFQIPSGIKRGKYDLKVKVGADEVKARDKLSVITGADAEELVKQRDREQYEGVGPEKEIVTQKFLLLDPPRLDKRRGELFIQVAGAASYPDNCVIFLALKLDGRMIANVDAYTNGGRFTAEFGPFKRRLFAANYEIEATFVASQQPRRMARMFKRAFPDERERAARSRAIDRQYVRLGSRSDENDHKRALRQHLEGTIDDAERLLEDLEEHFLSAGRSGFKEGGEVAELDWEEWLRHRSLSDLGEEDFRRRADKLAKAKHHLTSQGNFDDRSWREWLDHNWRGEVLGLARRHVEFRDSWEILKHPDAMLHLEEMLSVLMRLSQQRSQELYEKNHLPVHESDRRPPGADVIRLGAGRVGPAHFHQLVRRIKKELGGEG